MAEYQRIPNFGVANFRSFDADGFLLRDLAKVNVFIGKNNSGKSNVLRAVRLMARNAVTNLGFSPPLDHHRRSARVPEAIVEVPARDLVPEAAWPLYTRLPNPPMALQVRWEIASRSFAPPSPLAHTDRSFLDEILFSLTKTRLVGGQPNPAQYFAQLHPKFMERIAGPLAPFERQIYVPNFREIRVSERETNPDAGSGRNIVRRLREMQHPPPGNEADQEIFQQIEAFVADLLDVRALSIEIQHGDDRILVNMHGNRLPLDSYGSGVHQLVILCSVLAMHDNHVCMEEPEIHLHPELQRKFLRFISRQTTNTYFITTHSNVFLDFLTDVKVFHIGYDGLRTMVKRVDTSNTGRAVLTDMGYKASDLLQSNGIIWVEGPSDRVYLNRWLSFIDPELIENIHYAFVFFGGAVLAHFCCSDDPADDLVEVLRINRYAAFMIDRDGSNQAAKLRGYKQRILDELGDDACWITQGREIENYLSPRLLSEYLSSRAGDPVSVNLGADEKIKDAIIRALAGGSHATFDYSADKVGHARKIAELMEPGDLNVLDLRQRLDQLVAQIRAWNYLDGPAQVPARAAVAETQPAQATPSPS